MIDFGKRLTQNDKRKGTFFFPSIIIRQKHTSESREKKKERSCWQKIRQLLREYHTYVCK